MIINALILCVSLYFLVRGATLSTLYATRLAESFRLSTYTIGFLVIAIISILPETFIAVNAALKGDPSFGLGTLLGSNIADLTLIFAIIIFVAGRGLKVENKILKHHVFYPLILLLPLVLGFDGYFSRMEGIALIIAGFIFYIAALRSGSDGPTESYSRVAGRSKSLILLLVSMVVLLLGGHFAVLSATGLASAIGVSPILIGMLIVGLGTTMPELFFSLKAIKKHDDSLAIGDLLGTVLADATIVVGIIAVISPFLFPQKIIYVTGGFMLAASLMLFYFMRTGQTLTKKEAFLLLIFWVTFVAAELLVSA